MKVLIVRVVGSLFILLLSISLAIAQSGVKWMSFSEALEAQKVEKRKMVVDVYTEWCGWCKKMDQTTFQNEHIVNYLNEHFYPVKFDAEQDQSIDFNGRTYDFVKYGRKGYHALAVELTQGRLSYPTTVFLDEDLSVIQAIRGFQTALRFEQILTYFAMDHHKTTPWKKYSESYLPVISKN